MSFHFRSPREKVGGLYLFGRILDKIRYKDREGSLPEGYQMGVVPGTRTFDDRLCAFLGVSHDALTLRTLAGGSDEEVLKWCLEEGQCPDPEQIEVWNAFVEKRGWRDSGSKRLAELKAEAGFADREDIQTFFDIIDAEEGWK